jgi:fluoroacetyl-CoA thioesterase
VKPTIRPGLTHVKSLVVDRTRSIEFMGEEGRVYATPFLIRDIEHACRDLLLEHADANEDSVGIEVCVKHLAATLVDMNVEITATVAAVEGRTVSFEISARDDLEPIATGTHARFVLDTGKRLERLKAKAAKWNAARS